MVSDSEFADAGFCERLEAFRKHFKWSQTELGRKIGYSQPQFSAIEGGKESVTDRFIALLVAKTTIRESWIRWGQGEMLRSEAVAGDKENGTPLDMNMEEKPDQLQAMQMLIEIFQSGDQKAVEAICKNLEYFSAAAKRGQADRRKVIDPNWPAENERRQGGAGPKAPQG